MNTIPASAIVDVNPSVLSAGSASLDLSGLMLTTGTRVPIGQVKSFASATDVASYFGASSAEYAAAAIYFSGYVNKTAVPGALLFAQYPQAAVSAYIRGGSLANLSLAALQALNGTLTISVDGYSRTSSTIDLSSASSFSAAAGLIQTALDTAPTTEASFSGYITPNVFTASCSGNQLHVTAVTSGLVVPGQTVVSATGGTGSIAAGLTILSQTSGTPNGIGFYLISGSATAAGATLTLSGGALHAASVVATNGPIAVGQTVAGSGITVGTQVTNMGAATGSDGTYALNISQTVASSGSPEAMTTTPTNIAVTYDSVSSAFVITSGITGTPSTIAFATAGLAAPLALTSATGAVLSQGAAATTPAAFMTSVINQTTNWATFSTLFNPDGSGNANKLAFAQWNALQNNEFTYVCWDNDVTATNTVPATTSLGYLLEQSNTGGTCLVYDPSNEGLAAFVQGTVASINFNQKQGRITLAFKSGATMTATVTDQTTADNLIANGYNFYGAYATANAGFIFFYPGSVSGAFEWLDAYVNQILLNAAFQLALMDLLTSVGSIPYNPAGSSLIQAALAGPIAAALNFGAIQPNVVLSAAQAVEVDTAAGGKISQTLATRGWYLQVLPASPTARAARTSPPINFWYTDGGAVQQISMASIEVQ